MDNNEFREPVVVTCQRCHKQIVLDVDRPGLTWPLFFNAIIESFPRWMRIIPGFKDAVIQASLKSGQLVRDYLCDLHHPGEVTYTTRIDTIKWLS